MCATIRLHAISAHRNSSSHLSRDPGNLRGPRPGRTILRQAAQENLRAKPNARAAEEKEGDRGKIAHAQAEPQPGEVGVTKEKTGCDARPVRNTGGERFSFAEEKEEKFSHSNAGDLAEPKQEKEAQEFTDTHSRAGRIALAVSEPKRLARARRNTQVFTVALSEEKGRAGYDFGQPDRGLRKLSRTDP